jgi:hypothetical protein
MKVWLFERLKTCQDGLYDVIDSLSESYQTVKHPQGRSAPDSSLQLATVALHPAGFSRLSARIGHSIQTEIIQANSGNLK